MQFSLLVVFRVACAMKIRANVSRQQNFCKTHSGGNFFGKQWMIDSTFFSETAAFSVTQFRRQICPSSLFQLFLKHYSLFTSLFLFSLSLSLKHCFISVLFYMYSSLIFPFTSFLYLKFALPYFTNSSNNLFYTV